MRWMLMLLMMACSKPVTDADLEDARGRADAWLAAIKVKDCGTLVTLSNTAMTEAECLPQIARLNDRFITVVGVSSVREDPQRPGAVLAQVRIVEAAEERLIDLVLVRSNRGWVVAF